MSKIHKILFVCLGNICRSPAAQGVFQSIVDRNGRADDFMVDSAGTYSADAGALPIHRRLSPGCRALLIIGCPR